MFIYNLLESPKITVTKRLVQKAPFHEYGEELSWYDRRDTRAEGESPQGAVMMRKHIPEEQSCGEATNRGRGNSRGSPTTRVDRIPPYGAGDSRTPAPPLPLGHAKKGRVEKREAKGI